MAIPAIPTTACPVSWERKRTRLVADEFVTTVIDVAPKFVEMGDASCACHTSQLSAGKKKELSTPGRKPGKVYLRLVASDFSPLLKKREHSLFEGMGKKRKASFKSVPR